MMDAASMIEIAKAMRKLGAVRLDVRADGFVAEFSQPSLRASSVAKLPSGASQENEDAIVNDRRQLSIAEMERLLEERLDEYVPGH